MSTYSVPDVVKPVADAISLAVVVASLTSLLPSIAAALSIVWTIIRISETRTVRRMSRRRRGRTAGGSVRCD